MRPVPLTFHFELLRAGVLRIIGGVWLYYKGAEYESKKEERECVCVWRQLGRHGKKRMRNSLLQSTPRANLRWVDWLISRVLPEPEPEPWPGDDDLLNAQRNIGVLCVCVCVECGMMRKWMGV